jgi:hypothetical protein
MESPIALVSPLADGADVFCPIINRTDTVSVTGNPNTVALSII